MRKIKVKRLIYNHLGTGEIHYGGYEFDGNLTDDNILGTIFTLGKHQWRPNGYGMYQLNQKGELVYRIGVETFYRYQKSWYNRLWDCVRRII